MDRHSHRGVAGFLLLTLLGLTSVENPRAEEDLIPSVGPSLFKLTSGLSELKTIRVGSYPKSVSINSENGRAYICNLEGGSVDIVDPETLNPLKRIIFKRTPIVSADGSTRADSFEEKPVEIAYTGGGRYVWISLLRAGGVVVLDTENHRLPDNCRFKRATLRDMATGRRSTLKLRFIPTGEQPKVIAVSPDQKLVFVANWHSKDVCVIDAQKFIALKRIKTGMDPRGICFTETHAYVANFAWHTISEIDLATLKRTRNFANVGRNPRHLLVSPDGQSLYVSNHGDNHLRQIDLTTGKTLRTCSVGTEPRTICYSPSKKFIFVTNYKDDTVSAVNVDTMAELFKVKTLERPVGASFDAKTNTLWVTGYWDRSVRVYKFQNTLVRQTADHSTQARAF